MKTVSKKICSFNCTKVVRFGAKILGFNSHDKLIKNKAKVKSGMKWSSIDVRNMQRFAKKYLKGIGHIFRKIHRKKMKSS